MNHRPDMDLAAQLTLAAYEGADLLPAGRNVEVVLHRLDAHDGGAVSWSATLIGPYVCSRSCALPEDAVWDLIESIRRAVDAQRFRKANEERTT